MRTNRPQEGTEQRNTRAPKSLDNDCENGDVQNKGELEDFCLMSIARGISQIKKQKKKTIV